MGSRRPEPELRRLAVVRSPSSGRPHHGPGELGWLRGRPAAFALCPWGPVPVAVGFELPSGWPWTRPLPRTLPRPPSPDQAPACGPARPRPCAPPPAAVPRATPQPTCRPARPRLLVPPSPPFGGVLGASALPPAGQLRWVRGPVAPKTSWHGKRQVT